MAPGAAPPTNSRASSGVLGPLIARGIVLVLGLNGVFAAGYGAFGTWAVANDWLSCGVLANESDRPVPGVVRGVLELLGLAVEEAIRGAGVDNGVVLLAGLVERRVELVTNALVDALVGAAVDQQQV